jgi:hypothetical protein
MTTKPATEKISLPVGVWHEKNRNRYRIRLYAQRMVVHLSYHDTLEEALETYPAALAAQREALTHIPKRINTLSERITALRTTSRT